MAAPAARGGGAAAPAPAPPLISWTPAPGLTTDPACPGPRMGHAAALIPAGASVWGDDLVVVHGGLGPDRWALGDVACLQVGSGEWARPAVGAASPPPLHPTTAADGTLLPPPPSAPAPRAFHAAASIGAVLFVYGGHAWTPAGSGSGGGGGGGSPDGRGGGKVVKHGDLWALDCNEWKWTRLHAGGGGSEPSPVPRDFSAVAPLPDGRLVLVGGLDAADRRLDDAWVFCPATASASGGAAGWTPLLAPAPGRGYPTQARPKARYGHSLTTVGDRVFLFGGETAGGPSAELWALRGATAAPAASTPSARQPSDPGSLSAGDAPGPSWIALDLPGPPPTPRKGAASAALGAWLVWWGGRTLDPPAGGGGGLPLLRRGGPGTERVLGGPPVVMDRVGRVCWRTDGAGSVAPAAAPGPPPREFATLTPLPGGRLLLLGGGSGGVVWGDAWVGDTALAPFAGPAAPEAAPAATAAAAAQAAASAAAAAAATAVGGLPSLLRLPTRALGGLLLGRTGSGGGGGGTGVLTPLSGASSEDGGEGGRGRTSGAGRRRRHGAGHRPWWSASPAAPEFLALRRKVGLEAGPGPGPSRLGAAATPPPPPPGSLGEALAALAALQPGGAAFRGGLDAVDGAARSVASLVVSPRARFIGVEADGVRVSEAEAVLAAAAAAGGGEGG